jgi:hypothetical protein
MARANGWTSKKAAAQIARGTDSIREVLATQTDVLDAMDVPSLGIMNFRWGLKKAASATSSKSTGKQMLCKYLRCSFLESFPPGETGHR